ncbi:hypothetical protein F4813DRAFT_393659 [Daldinia decipiens]|uniref:uncharacterized protein n=1 Tax=Daldinia decipiens TaxID=326647 RepID=UPI0020C3EBD4|nr:uncharacterized protein F4813DRAFT_393659 [Daldinia decipiens]KAI1653473.1 hypothetical protein F4813DRAFT_393659 [Daldinia decipiens]
MFGDRPITVFKQPLKLFSQQPMTGFFRDGYCRTGGGIDPGNHAVAGIVTDEFLDFSASHGNDLRQAYRGGRITNLGVPRVDLDATEDSALVMVDMDAFRQFAVRHNQSNVNGSGSGAT